MSLTQSGWLHRVGKRPRLASSIFEIHISQLLERLLLLEAVRPLKTKLRQIKLGSSAQPRRELDEACIPDKSLESNPRRGGEYVDELQ